MIYAILFRHTHAPASVRQKIYEFWETLFEKGIPGVTERLLLVTCYRVEAYFCADNLTHNDILRMFVPEDIQASAEVLVRPEDVFQHIVYITCGADSPAIGEPHIQGQVRKAYLLAKEKGWVGKILSQAFERALQTAGKIREDVRLQLGSYSIPKLVVQYIQEVMGKRGTNILLVGTGEMGIAISKYLRQEGLSFAIATRSEERAEFLKNHLGIETLVYTDNTLPRFVELFPVVIFATASDGFLLTKENIRKSKVPSIIIDLGFPENVDPALKEMGVRLYQIDDFKQIIELRTKDKVHLRTYAEFRSRVEGEKFLRWLEREQMSRQLLNYIDEKIESILEKELNGNRDELKKTIERLKFFLLYPTMKALRSGLPIEEVIRRWVEQ